MAFNLRLTVASSPNPRFSNCCMSFSEEYESEYNDILPFTNCDTKLFQLLNNLSSSILDAKLLSIVGAVCKKKLNNFVNLISSISNGAILFSLISLIVIKNPPLINNNLEQQARSLFKSWFIDYEPFQDTIPNDWKKGKLRDVLQLKRKSIKAGSNTTLPYLPIDSIPMRTFALTGFKPNEEAQSSLIAFDKDDIIIGAMRVYFHRVVLAPCDGITRTTCFTLTPFQKEYLSFSFLCCDQDSSIDYAQNTSKGSTMPYAIWDGGLGDMEIVIPSPQTAEKFNELVLPMLRQVQNSYFENNRLRELRDNLLPHLMSGELDVSNIAL